MHWINLTVFHRLYYINENKYYGGIDEETQNTEHNHYHDGGVYHD